MICFVRAMYAGPWNSWDRVPYITDIRTGKPSIIPSYRLIHHNMVLGTYYSQATIDTDDGSAYYRVYENFLAFAANGLKSDFGGHDNVWTRNVLAYPETCYDFGFDAKGNTSFPGYNDGFANNSCIFRRNYMSTCNWEHGLDRSVSMHDNKVYSATGSLTICDKSWDEFKKTSRDTGTTLGKWPSDGELVHMAKQLLSF
jgi:hypothetical protein